MAAGSVGQRSLICLFVSLFYLFICLRAPGKKIPHHYNSVQSYMDLVGVAQVVSFSRGKKGRMGCEELHPVSFH